MRSTRGLKAQAVFERYYTELGEYIDDQNIPRPAKQPGIPDFAYLTKVGGWKNLLGPTHIPEGRLQRPAAPDCSPCRAGGGETNHLQANIVKPVFLPRPWFPPQPPLQPRAQAWPSVMASSFLAQTPQLLLPATNVIGVIANRSQSSQSGVEKPLKGVPKRTRLQRLHQRTERPIQLRTLPAKGTSPDGSSSGRRASHSRGGQRR